VQAATAREEEAQLRGQGRIWCGISLQDAPHSPRAVVPAAQLSDEGPWAPMHSMPICLATCSTKHLDLGSIYRNIVMKYASATGISAKAVGVCVHSMRATAASNALSKEADIAKV
jgi:hypothetical protein